MEFHPLMLVTVNHVEGPSEIRDALEEVMPQHARNVQRLYEDNDVTATAQALYREYVTRGWQETDRALVAKGLADEGAVGSWQEGARRWMGAEVAYVDERGYHGDRATLRGNPKGVISGWYGVQAAGPIEVLRRDGAIERSIACAGCYTDLDGCVHDLMWDDFHYYMLDAFGDSYMSANDRRLFDAEHEAWKAARREEAIRDLKAYVEGGCDVISLEIR